MDLLGNISKNLYHYLNDCDFFSKNFTFVLNSFESLYSQIYDNGIVISDFFPHNILLKKTSENSYHFVILEEFGSRAFIPIWHYSKTLARIRFNKKWSEFLRYINQNNALTRKLVAELHKFCQKPVSSC
jgi:hypothetical protein